MAVALPSDQGIMEQWLAYVRPDGHVAFGPYVLSPLRWSRDAAPEETRRRLPAAEEASPLVHGDVRLLVPVRNTNTGTAS